MKKHLLAALIFLAAAGPVAAGTREDVQAASARCARIADDRAWLDCYYGAVQPMRARLGLAPANPAQIALVPSAPGVTSAPPPARVTVRRKGWLAGLVGGDDDRLRLASYSFSRNGLFTVTLANGEVLAQRADDTNYAHWRGPASGLSLSLSTAAFGSQTLEDASDGAIYEVQRVR